MKKIILTLIILFVILGSSYGGYKYYKEISSDEYKLERIGYSNDDIEVIKEKLDSLKIKIILDNDYLDNLALLLSDSRYQEEYFNDYLEGLKSKKDIEKIYFDLREDVIALRNGNYYIENNLSRYQDYFNKYPEKEIDEVIRSVNSNIDYSFYTNMFKANVDDGYLLLANKYSYLDKNYKSNLVTMKKYTSGSAQMEKKAYEYFVKMCDAAKRDNISLYNVSAYRSYSTQNYLYNNYVKNRGKTNADTFSARPGSSEHQTGLASDINTASSSAHFENSKEYAWLIKNSYKYGFILRYPKGKEYITGYKFEPWHYRYVGVEAATYIVEHDLTFEEYYAYFVQNKNTKE